MRKLLFFRAFLLVLFGGSSFFCTAQGPLFLTADSLRKHSSGWPVKSFRFQPGDNPAWAAPDFDDHAWPLLSPKLLMPKAAEKQGFKGIGWFRLRFVVDSSLAMQPLAYTFSQQGASIVYLDGKPLDTFGRIEGAQRSVYYDPGNSVHGFVLPSAGPHVLAIRYANYEAAANWKRYATEEAGFTAFLGFGEDLSEQRRTGELVMIGLMMMLLGLFLALALLHFLLFFFNTRNRSHLLFALFSLCVSLTGAFTCIFNASTSPAFDNRWTDVAGLVPFGLFFFLSAFLNSLFPARRRWVFWTITALCAVSAVLLFVPHIDVSPLMAITIAIVAIEAVVITVRAMIQRRPGARILGWGFLLFAAFVLSIFVLGGLGITSISFKSGDNPAKGFILVLLLVLVVLSIPLSISAFLAWSVARTNKDLKLRLDEVAALSEQTRRQEEEKQKMLESRQEELEREVALRTEDLRYQKQRSDDLLLNILPAEVAEELKEKGSAAARQFGEVSVLFTDFAGFTQVSERLSPQVLVQELHACFTAFDAIMEKWGLEKIKTIGDAYLAVCGLPVADPRHAQNTVSAALEILQFIAEREQQEKVFQIRIGIHSGPVVAGIVGVKKFAYDIWGDTVNIAARMEQSGEPGKVNISQATYELVKEDFACTPRGKIAAKGKGEVEMYFVQASIPQPSFQTA